MKGRWITLLLIAVLPALAMAQSNDDLYFVPKKRKAVEQKKEDVKKVQRTDTTAVYAAPGSTKIVVKDVTGQVRDVDEYNRRYTSRENTFTVENDTLYIEEKPYNERGEWVNGFDGSQDDYEYAMRIVRFRSPRYAIPVSSPLYWEVTSGIYPSWDWNVYDDGLYAYVFPTYTNPMWWDWRWNWGVSGPRWGFGFYGPNWSFSWGSSWYSPWYSPYWYGGYWGGYWPGYWGPGWHHHHPYYNGGWYARGHTDYRPSRYSGYSSSLRRGSVRTGSVRETGERNTSLRRGASVGRVVSPRNTGRGESYSVYPTTTRGVSNRVVGTGNTNSSRGHNSYTRPATTIDRSGSNRERSSNIRSRVDYTRSSNPRNTYNSSRSSNTRSTYSSGSGSSGGYGSMGGGSSRIRSGSSRR